MIRLAIFASGTGTNAENIIRYFTGHSLISVSLVVSNKADAKVLVKAARHHIPTQIVPPSQWQEPDQLINLLDQHQIDYLILAGFLLKIPPLLIDRFKGKILNLHPALLPDHGGKGMYGDKVHQSVLERGDKVSGITIHLVNEIYDAGRILFQAPCPVEADDTPDTLAKRIHELEYKHYPKIIEQHIFPHLKPL